MISKNLRLLKIIPVLFVVLISGCKTSISPEQIASADYGKLPSNYQEAIKGHMKTLLFDPDSAHYRFVDDPIKGYAYVLGTLDPPVFGQLVTVRINAKGRLGEYVGEKPYTFLFKNEKFWMLSEFITREVVQ